MAWKRGKSASASASMRSLSVSGSTSVDAERVWVVGEAGAVGGYASGMVVGIGDVSAGWVEVDSGAGVERPWYCSRRWRMASSMLGPSVGSGVGSAGGGKDEGPASAGCGGWIDGDPLRAVGG